MDLYRKSEEMLDKDYRDYSFLLEGIDVYERLDLEKVKDVRRENGWYLMKELKGISGIRLIYSSLMDDICPLFVPVLIENGTRDALRKYLIQQGIYCPVHWPLSPYHVLESEEEKELYEKELSLVCDQRYAISDMKKIVQCISDFWEV